ncbi:EscU/YscU/HrcU family type III secretion system export apparatus switch protein [uncultured Erythrobacter sp.]|uniref:EscU/YscU/HrcU family type III secretion system export apparatus switch protein n=1 Tax=uncultured Erythrobacter sp. TaxID=263913 RepID=UPI00261D5B1C|nr:EscU/YscU/HrcU family type III secretion system export apparatus switch protein [uncultured Erythrobacter sp.]
MSEQGEEQNKTEEPTPFKLKKAREKGQVARGMDLGFSAGLIALAFAASFLGQRFVVQVADVMRFTFATGIDGRGDANEVLGIIASIYWYLFQPLIIFGCIVAILLITLDLLQLRGLIFSAHPLKPDFKRLNPAKGLKRIFSLRMVKETIKNIVKFSTYTVAAYFVISSAIEQFGIRLTDASKLAMTMEEAGLWLLYVFIAFSLVFAAIDQIIVRGEFRKQMRMSRRELTRETKDREGEPRIKQKRKELHQQMSQQSENLGAVPGADMVVVNPEHYAVALSYDPENDSAPKVRAMGRNHLAQLIKRKAGLHAVPIIPNPPLARALYADCRPGGEIPPAHYRKVAAHYRQLQVDKTPMRGNMPKSVT